MVAKFSSIWGLEPAHLNMLVKLSVYSLLLLQLKVYLAKYIKVLFIPKSSCVVKHWQKMVQS